MTEDKDKYNSAASDESSSNHKASSTVTDGEQNAPAKKPYSKPTLRKFSQIDYVTAYGID